MAALLLGTRYRDGAGVRRDGIQASTYFEMAVDAGSTEAIYLMVCR